MVNTQFKDQSFASRFNQLGDLAEGQFRMWAARNQVHFEDFGFHRPDIRSFPRLSAFMRYKPDFVAEYRAIRPYETFLCEVKGCGADQLIKIKEETYEALDAWEIMSELPVLFFLYDSTQKRVSRWLSLERFTMMIPRARVGYFNDNKKKYFEVPTNWIETWEFVPQKAAA